MKTIFLLVLVSCFVSASGQYYYRDIMGTEETAETMRAYKANQVKKVVLSSYDGQAQKIEDFVVEQSFSPSTNVLTTISKSGVSGESYLITYLNEQGSVIKTIDSSEKFISTTIYNYTNSGALISIKSLSNAPGNSILQEEEHLWQYEGSKPSRMLRIKNKVDTTYVEFKRDDAGNIIEEYTVRRGVKSEPVFYYYDSKNRLTDIVRFNNRANRLLPEYMFEYSASNQVIQKMTFPANSSNYLIWRYQFDDRGLKVQEAVFNKEKKLTGRIKYEYLF